MGERANLEAEIGDQRATRDFNQKLVREDARNGDRPGKGHLSRSDLDQRVTSTKVLD